MRVHKIFRKITYKYVKKSFIRKLYWSVMFLSDFSNKVTIANPIIRNKWELYKADLKYIWSN